MSFTISNISLSKLDSILTNHFQQLPRPTLSSLGWSDFFGDQILPEEAGLLPARVAAVHRTRITAISHVGPIQLVLSTHTNTSEFAVGDWVLADPAMFLLQRCLNRRTVLERHVSTSRVPQLAGANIDTLFIVTSCNAEFDVARLERYLALANEADIRPVILLTKADLADNAGAYLEQATALQRGLSVVVSNPRVGDASNDLRAWCGVGQTVALVGSSGVGKSTMVNALTGAPQNELQRTGNIREHDAQGRHTTTSRSLHAIPGGGWVIDTPGIRTLHLGSAAAGIGELFAEFTEIAPLCKFRDCTHIHEPGCAILKAVSCGTLDPERLLRWRDMVSENRTNTLRPAKQTGGKPGSHRRTRPIIETD
jgi:ribosome biogenesis GTPase